MSDTCGRTSDASSARQGLLWHSSRTSEDTSPSDSERFWKTSRPTGSMRSGRFYARPKLELPTIEPGSLFWPTAVVTDSFGARNATAVRDGSKGGQGRGNPGTTLCDAIRMWPTPATRDYKGANGAEHLENGTGRKHLDQPPNFVAHCSHHGRTTSTDGTGGSTPAVLNPPFVETLMGLPIGWTGSEPSATEWSHYRQQLRSAYLRIVRST